MIAYSKRFWGEAKGKVTAYLGVAIAAAGETYANWDLIQPVLPHWPWVARIAPHVFAILGLCVVYARVRRAMAAPQGDE